MFQAGRAIYSEHGLQGLYRGLGVTLIEIIPYAALQFGLYDAFNQMWTAAAEGRRQQRQQRRQQQGQGPGGSVSRQQQQQQQYSSSTSSSSGGGSLLDNKRLQTFSCGLAAGREVRRVSLLG